MALLADLFSRGGVLQAGGRGAGWEGGMMDDRVERRVLLAAICIALLVPLVVMR
jgi:hypothetical protein